MSPQIVVIAYNRPKSLKQLLDSIATANYPAKEISLVISIDGEGNEAVIDVAESFAWNFGAKEIIVHEKRLGLKRHIYSACDRAASKGPFIVLEDDLGVSPFFYQFATETIDFFNTDSNIAGISLYAYSIAESCLLPFSPLEDGYDNYFMKFPSSWGQCFTTKQWQDFRKFISERGQEPIKLPAYIADWKRDSWKKEFSEYLISKNLYFVFPEISLTTNFAEKGTNFPFRMDIFEVPMQEDAKKYSFQYFSDSLNKFDEHFELLPEALKKLSPYFSAVDFAVDLYGTKDISSISETNVLTVRKAKNSIKSFGKSSNNALRNILSETEGNEFVLCNKEDVYGKIKKPDFGDQIFIQNNFGKPESNLSFISKIFFRIKFSIRNYFHWTKKLFLK